MPADDFDLTNPPWAAPPYDGDSDEWGDEQDRSEWFEAAASYWAGRALAAEARPVVSHAEAQELHELIGATIEQLARARELAAIVVSDTTPSNEIIYATSEHDRADLPFPLAADAWFWSTGNRWCAVYADFHDDWWEGADPEDVAARPTPWRRPIADVPTSGWLVYRTESGAIVTRDASQRQHAGQ